jgi:hypothetical protein
VTAPAPGERGVGVCAGGRRGSGSDLLQHVRLVDGLAAMSDPSRDHGLVVYGASGFVGTLLADYLAAHAPDDVRIALAGRSRGRVEAVRAGLPERARGWPVLVADSTDAAAPAALASSTRVLATTVGPYARHGAPRGRGLSPRGHALCRPDRRGPVRPRRDRPLRRPRPRDRGPARPLLRLRLDPLGPRDAPAPPAGRRGRRGRARGGRAARLRTRRLQWRHRGLAARPAGDGRRRPRAAPDRRGPARAEPGPCHGAREGTARGRRPAEPPPGRHVGRALRDGAVQHADRAAQQRLAGLGLRPGSALRRGRPAAGGRPVRRWRPASRPGWRRSSAR